MDSIPREIDVVVVEHDAAEQAKLHSLLSEKWVGLLISTHGNEESARGYLASSLTTPSAILPKVVLLSLDLPASGGFRLLEAMKRDAGLCRIPVVAYAALTHQELIRRSYDLHANCVVQRSRVNGEHGAFVAALDFWLGLVELPAGRM